MSESVSPGSKAKSLLSVFDLHVGKARTLKPGAQCAAVDGYISVPNVRKMQKNPGDAVGSRKYRTRPEYAVNLAEQLILQLL